MSKLIYLGIYLIFLLTILKNASSFESNNTNDKIKSPKEKRNFVFLAAGGQRIGDPFKNHIYMVSIRSRIPKKYFGDNHFCGGVIIGVNTILTAAHCVMELVIVFHDFYRYIIPITYSKRKVLTRARRLLVVAGTPNRLRMDATTIQYPVKSIWAHPKYVFDSSVDLAVIKIKGHMPNNNVNVAIKELPSSPPKDLSPCTALGWGRLYAVSRVY